MRVNAEEKLAAIVIADVADYECPMTRERRRAEHRG
jgi:hypothetical protein